MDNIDGLPSGFPEIDEKISGLKRGNLIMVCARPGVGKRQFVINIANYMSGKKELYGAVFSKTISCSLLQDYWISKDAVIDIDHRSDLNKEELDRWIASFEYLFKVPIYFNDNSCITLYEIYTKCKQLKHDGKLDYLIIADDIQNLSFGKRFLYKNSKLLEQNHICFYLKWMAKKLNIPIVIVSRLPRIIDYRHDHRLVLSDFSTMGNIDWWVDVVLYIFRDDYYTKSSSYKPGIAEINIIKNHNNIGSVELAYIRKICCFANMQILF